MKASTTISSLALLASTTLAALQNVSLFVASDDKTLNGSGVSAPHEGAGIGYLFIGTDGGYFATANTVPLVYDTVAESLYWWSTPQIKQGFSTFTNTQNGISVVELIVGDYSGVTFENGYLAYEGSTAGFYALGNISDPYDYSKFALAVVKDVDASPEGGIPISLTAVFESSTVAPTGTTILTTAPTSTILPSTTVSPTTTVSNAYIYYGNSTTIHTTVAAQSVAHNTTSVNVISEGGAVPGHLLEGTLLGAAALAVGLLL